MNIELIKKNFKSKNYDNFINNLEEVLLEQRNLINKQSREIKALTEKLAISNKALSNLQRYVTNKNSWLEDFE